MSRITIFGLRVRRITSSARAIYLSDPEGNGIEVYRDRQPDEWNYQPDGTVEMATKRLDLQALYESAGETPFRQAADGTAIGHIHLQVGALPQADAFYQDVLGLKIMARYPGASFFGYGAYHHHVAANIWNSRGAETRKENMTGLSGYSLKFNEKETLDTALAALDRIGNSDRASERRYRRERSLGHRFEAVCLTHGHVKRIGKIATHFDGLKRAQNHVPFPYFSGSGTATRTESYRSP